MDSEAKIFIEEVNKKTKNYCETSERPVFGLNISDVGRTDQIVHPQLGVTDFFQGGTGFEEVNYSASTDPPIKRKTPESEVFIKEIHNRGRYVILVGAAGSGKTTLAKRYSVMMLETEKEKKFDMIHFINIRDFGIERCTPRKLLFERTLIEDKLQTVIEVGYDWLQKKRVQKRILFVFDGFDTAPWNLDSSSRSFPKIGYYDEASPAVIIYNILCKDGLFPNCNILLTSREYGISELSPQLRPDAVIALRGLVLEDMKVLVDDLGESYSKAIWEAIKDKSKNLMHLCSNPLFLMFVIIIYKSQDEYQPSTFSGIIIHLIERHIRSIHRTKEQISEVLQKLKLLSYRALKKQRVVFNDEDLDKAGLKANQVDDLVICNPKSDGGRQEQLLCKDHDYFFCHQAMQEALAAQHICEMKNEEFDKELKTFLSDRMGSIVRLFTCGILFNEEIANKKDRQKRNNEDDDDKHHKRSNMIATLENDLERDADNPTKLLQHLICLRECGEDKSVKEMAKTKLHGISLPGVALTPSDIHAIGKVATYCDELEIMHLANCQLDRRLIEILVAVMSRSDVKVTVFDVSFNSKLRKDSMYFVHKVCIRGQGLNYWQCGFRQNHILDFKDKDNQAHEQEIRIFSTEQKIEMQFEGDENYGVLEMESYNVMNHYETLENLASREIAEEKTLRVNINNYDTGSNNQQSAFLRLATLLTKCHRITELAISNCTINDDNLQKIADAVKQKKIPSINVYLCPELSEKSWGIIGTLVGNCHSDNLYVTACALEAKKLGCLKSSLKTKEKGIQKLDISRNNQMRPDCLKKVGEIIEDCKIKELVAGYCELECDHVNALANGIKNAKMQRIDFSGNTKFGVDGFRVVGELVSRTEVKQLDISECDPGSEELESFKNATKKAKLKKLNVSRNRRMDAKGMQQVAEMTGLYTLDDLLIRQCELDEGKLRAFEEAIPRDAKIIHLGLGLYFMEKKPTEKEEIPIIIKILPRIDKKLTLSGWDISKKMEIALQAAIDNIPYRDLQIVLDRGDNRILKQRNKNNQE